MQILQQKKGGELKAPAFQFYVMDWSTDLDDHPLEIEGAWIRICCKLWRAENRGELIKSVVQWSRILRIDIQKTKEILNYISNEKIGDVTPRNVLEIENNTKITVKSRRMVRERIDRENNRLRQARWRGKKKDNGKRNERITPPTSTSSSTSPSSSTGQGPVKNLNRGVYLNGIVKKMQTLDEIQIKKPGNKKINIWAWVNSSVASGGHPKAIDYSLEHLILKWGTVKDPWPYITAIFQMQNGNFWEQEHIYQSTEFKY